MIIIKVINNILLDNQVEIEDRTHFIKKQSTKESQVRKEKEGSTIKFGSRIKNKNSDEITGKV